MEIATFVMASGAGLFSLYCYEKLLNLEAVLVKLLEQKGGQQ